MTDVAAAAAQERQRIRDFVAGASLELSSRDPAEIDACRELLEQGTAIYISMPPGQAADTAIAPAVHLARAGFRPVPHLAARRIAGHQELDEFLARASGEAGVDSALVIAGDSDRVAGPFDSSLALLETGLFQKHGIVHVGVAGHPEGHPTVSTSVLAAALQAKKLAADRAGLGLQVVTQFCFESAPVLSWLGQVPQREIPVRVGLAGPASLPRLLRFAALCGIGNSVRALTARPRAITRLLTETGPEAVVRDLARQAGAPVAGLHFFCFGGLVRTARWLRAVREGRFELTPDAGFRVETA
jgi:methylenetetrahydrofolate reductase (NADPH)